MAGVNGKKATEPGEDKEKKSRRARGTGSIRFNKRRGCWVGRLPIGRHANGKTRYAERSGDTQREVIDALKMVAPAGPDTAVGAWCDRWVAGADVRAGTLAGYRHTVENYVKPALGHVRLRDLTAYHVEAAARAWVTRPADPIRPTTARLYLSHLSTAVNAAVRAGVVPANVVLTARRPKGGTRPIDPFPPADLLRVLAAAAPVPGLRSVALMAATGLRVGEALALTVADWDPKARTLSVTKTRSKFGVGPPKSPNSVRTVRVPDEAVPAVRDAIGKRKIGAIFTNTKGRPLDHRLVATPFYAMLKRMGLARRNLHQLRHSVATHHVAAGVPIPDVAAYLGDTPDTIVRTYLHPTGADPAAAIDKVFAQVRAAGLAAG